MQLSDISGFNENDVAKVVDKRFKKLIAVSKSSDNPFAVLCGGQPGAGKTTIHGIQSEINPGIIIINGDEYRNNHPNFERIQSQYGDDSVLYTQPFANAVVEGLIDRLSSEKYPLVIEGTLRDPNVPLKTCDTLKNKGYSVEMHIIAVNKNESWQGTIDRYNRMKNNGQTARATPKDKHDEVVEKLPDNLSTLYQSGQFDRIALYTRDKNCIFDSLESPGKNPKELLFNVLHS